MEPRGNPQRFRKHYRKKHANGKSYQESRFVVEQHIGRELSPSDVVHHLNGDIHDNRIENLEALPRAEHSRKHQVGKKYSAEFRQKVSDGVREWHKNRRQPQKPPQLYDHCVCCGRILLQRDRRRGFCGKYQHTKTQ